MLGMGTYYFLINETKKKKIHFNNLIKANSITDNSEIHKAFVNYMFNNQNDEFSIESDSDMLDHFIDYEDVDLAKNK